MAASLATWRGRAGTLWFMLLWLHHALIRHTAGDEKVYFDKYGHCHAAEPFDLRSEEYRVVPQGGGFRYEAMRCAITFRGDRSEGVCLNFDHFHIDDCQVKLLIFHTDSNAGTPWRELHCSDPKPSQMCTKSRYVTLEVVKTHLNSNKGYDFSIRVKQSDNIIEEGVVVASISAFVGIVVGVVVLIAVVACTILYCCLKRTRSGPAGVAAAGGAGRGGGGAGGEGSNKDVESARQHDSLVEPTAPPLPDAEESHERQRLYPQAPQLYPQPATPQLYPTTPQLYPPAEDPPPYVHPPPYDEQDTTTAAGHAHSPHDVTAVKQAL